MSLKYKHPSIEEAVCEFLFAPNPGVPGFDLTLPGRLQTKLDPDYPGPSRNQYHHLLQVSQAGSPALTVNDESFRVQLFSADQRGVVGIGRDALTVSALRRYEGWELFKPRIVRALDAYRAVASQRPVIRIGLRYINRFVAPVVGGELGNFIGGMWSKLEAKNLADGSSITGDLFAINNRHEFLTADGFKIGITGATLQPQAPGTSEFLLDIDAAWDMTPIDNREQVVVCVDRLHVFTGSVFESLITNQTRQLLDAD